MANYTNSDRIKYYEMIESIIERMSKNSFQLKGWTMTLVSAISAFSALSDNELRQNFVVFAIIPVIGFWILDSYYLQQERRYRQLYKNVVESNDEISFNLNTSRVTGNPTELDKLKYKKCFFSVSEVSFYGIVLAAVIVLIILFKINGS